MGEGFLSRATTICALAVCSMMSAVFAQSADTTADVTVEAHRLHVQLEHDVQTFTHAALIRPPAAYHQSLERWNDGVCAQVLGLNPNEGDFIRSRLLEIAGTAGVPLAGESCRANLLVFVTVDTASFLKKMVKQPRLFDGTEDRSEVKAFIEAPRPIRVWRNIMLTTIDGSQQIKASGEHQYKDEHASTSLPSQYGSRLSVSQVTRDFISVLVVVDATKVKGLNMGQLGDYIGMISFAQMDLDQEITNVPTILNLFRFPRDKSPPGMSKWDRALLKGLYNSPQRDALQVSELEAVAVRTIETEK